MELGLVDEIVSLEEGVKLADLVVLATPVDSLPQLAVEVLDNVLPHQTIIDVGSTKEALCEAVASHPQRGRFVATHPMWGTEYSGPEAAQKEAFKGRNVVICEGERSDADALALVEQIYTDFGMPIVRMGAEDHDLNIVIAKLVHHIVDQVKSLLSGKPAYHSDHELLFILDQAELLLKRKLVFDFFLAEVLQVVFVFDELVL